mgnify:CR=1 FL=1
MLQAAFDNWCTFAEPELADKVGMSTLPDQKFVSQETDMDKLFATNRGQGSKHVDNNEWLVRRLVELNAHIATNRPGDKIIHNMLRKVAKRPELKQWQDSIQWLKQAEHQHELAHILSTLHI